MTCVLIISILFNYILPGTNSITCNGDNCTTPIQDSNIICMAEGCRDQEIICPSDSACTIDCNADKSCHSANVSCPANGECNIQCNNLQACKRAVIYCSANAPCNIQCGGSNSCEGVDFYSKSSNNGNNPMSISCLNQSSCIATNVNAGDSSSLTITGCTEILSCQNILIYCPPANDDGPQCSITGNSSTGSTGLDSVNFYLINGWTDINITATSTSRTGSMSCGVDYTASCTIQTATNDADPWECADGLNLICPTYEPTSSPTTKIPTELPTTSNPSHDPTSDPSSFPTADPTKFPTYMPTIEPTVNPTTNPSHQPTLNPSTDLSDESPLISPSSSVCEQFMRHTISVRVSV